jgi:glycosyltransferase involved in cell wall biosynthesis
MHGETMESLGYQFDGSMTSPDPDLDHLVLEKLGKAVSPPDRKYRILMEADKVILPDNDGVKRYQVDLLKGLARVCENPHSRWDIDLYIRNSIHPISEFKDLIFNPFRNSDLNDARTGRKKRGRSLIETFERAMVRLIPDRFAAWLHRNNIRVFHQTYIFLKKVLLGTVNLALYILRFIYGQLNVLYSNTRQLFIVPRSEREFRSYDLIHLPLKQHYFPFRKTRTPLLTTVHDLTHRYYPHFHTPVNISNAEKGLKFIKRSGSHVLAVSRSTLHDTRKELQVGEEKLHMVYEASDRQKFHFEVNREDTARVREKYGIPADTAYFLCLSTLEPRKNIANTIKAFNELVTGHPDYPLALVVAGKKGWLTQQTILQDQIYNERIVYTGFIDDDDLSSIYTEALALCYLSFYEGFGLPALEAMSCGTPVLYANTSSLPEVVGKGGLAADPRNVKDISNKMKLLFEDKELSESLRREALRQSLKFSWRKTLLDTLSVYEKVINFERNSKGSQ